MTSERLALSVVVTLLLSHRPALALDPAQAPADFPLQAWRLQNGLPQDSVHSIVQTADGYVWVGTLGGVARFNGSVFTSFDRYNVLRPARGGGLWLGADDGVTLFKDGVWRPVASRLSSVSALFEDDDGTLWVGSWRGLFRLAQGRSTFVGGHRDPPPAVVTAIHRDRAGRLLFGTNDGLWRADGPRMTPFPPAAPVTTPVRAIIEDRRGRLWIGTDRGLLRLEGDSRKDYAERDGLPSALVRAVVIDRDDRVWIGTRGGLARLDVESGSIAVHGPKAGLPSDDVLALLEDREGGLWVGTGGGGLVRLTDRRARALDEVAGMDVKTVAEDRTGALWIGTTHGLLRRQGGVTTRYTTADGLPNDAVLSILPTASGDVSIGTYWGLARWRDGKLSAVPSLAGTTPAAAIRAQHEGPSGTLWIGTDGDRLARVRGDAVQVIDAAGSVPRFIRALHEDRRGVVWVAGIEDLALYEDGRFVRFEARDGLPDKMIRSFHEDASGTLWMASRNAGLIRYRDRRFTAFGTSAGLPANELHQVLEDGARRLWLGSSLGVFSVAISELDAYAANPAGVGLIPGVAIQVAGGQRSFACSGGVQPAGWRGRDGNLWFAARPMGVVSIDPGRAPPSTFSPPVVIEEVLVDDRPVAPGAGPSFAPGTRSVTIHYAALTFSAPHRVRYRVRLEGFHDDWRPVGDSRVARFDGLAPGHYELRVLATNGDGVWGREPARFAFNLAPRFVQTFWFRAMCALAVGLAIAWLYRLRLVRLRAIYDARLSERTRLARELHDKLLQGMTAVTWQIDGALSRLPPPPSPSGDVRQRLEVAQTMITQSVDEARRVVWDLRGQANSRSDLGTALGAMASRLGADHGITIDFAVDGPPCAVTRTGEENLFQIAKEAVTNAVKHGRPRRIEVRLQYGGESVRLSVRDDGVGFDPARGQEGHFGLLGLAERAATIAGRLVVDSKPGQGTTVEIVVPVQKPAHV